MVGEAIKKQKLKNWYDTVGEDIKIINLYGSTETGLAKMFYEIEKNDINMKNIPIGKPMPMVRTIILDENLQPCQPGEIGELYIRTKYLSHGYYKNEELTKKVFMINPFTKKENDIIYKTGDIGRLMDDGNFELIGRKDRQIKIRGNRVEISEIEDILIKFYKVNNCVVNFYNDDKLEEIYLVAYIIANNEIIESEIKNKLRDFIPEYMIPKFIVQIQEIPLTASGKVNYKKLSSINSSILGEYIEPQNEYEYKLEKIWCEILNIERVSTSKNFFDIGGHSLKIMNLISKVYKVFGIELPFEIIFKNISLKEMAEYIKSKIVSEKNNYISDNNKIVDVLDLTLMQEFFISNNVNKVNSNQKLTLFYKERFNEDALKNTLKNILQKYYILNSKFDSDTNKFKIIDSFDNINLKIHDLKNNYIIEENIKNLYSVGKCNIDRDSTLIQIDLFNTKDGDYLVITMHDFIVDNTSWNLFLKDFYITYKEYQGKEVIDFIRKDNYTKKYREALINYVNNRERLSEIDYWKQIDKKKIIELPKDKKINAKKSIKFKSANLSKEYTNNLLNKTNIAYNTNTNEILLTAMSMAVNEWAKNNEVLVNINSHNRLTCYEGLEISNEINCFINQYPLIFEIQEKLDKNIKHIKDVVRKIGYKGIILNSIKYLSNNYDNIYKDLILDCEITFNELMNLDDIIPKDIFQIVDFDIEESFVQDHNIKFSFVIKQEKLNINIAYDNNKYEEETIDNLLNYIVEGLTSIINHCMNIKETETTISDVVIGDIDTDGLLEYINNI